MVLLTACTRSPVETLQPPETSPSITASPTLPTTTSVATLPNGSEVQNAPTPTLNATREPDIPRTRYQLDIELDYDAKLVFATQDIDYTNTTGRMIKQLPINVPPAENDGIFFLSTLQVQSSEHQTRSEFKDSRIDVLIDPPLHPGQTIKIHLEYQLRLPMRWEALGYTQRQLLLADWYPQIPPYIDATGWIINPPGLVGEHLAYPLNDFELNLCLTPSRDNLVVAASAPMIARQDHCYHYRVENRRNFTLGISPYYQMTTISNEHLTVEAYTFPEHANLGLRAAKLGLQAWVTFSEIFGPNTRKFISIVEADIFDGLETDGLIFLSQWYYQTADPTPKNYFTLLLVHEIAHQWFYGYIHNDQAKEPWLDEALTTYSELLFIETHHPELIDWWWQFRVKSFAPTGSVNASIYNFTQFQPYINAVYLQGATFLHELRNVVGDEAFFEGLYQYVQAEGGLENWRSAYDFINHYSQIPGVDLTEIIAEFFQ